MARTKLYQHSVHAKLDALNYAWYMQEQLRSGISGNRLLNRAIELYIAVKASERYHVTTGRGEDFARKLLDLKVSGHYRLDGMALPASNYTVTAIRSQLEDNKWAERGRKSSG